MAKSEKPNILPIWKVVKLSYRDTFKYSQQLLIPILVFSIVTIAQWRISASSLGSWRGPVFNWILEIVFAIPFVVNIHRMVLLNEMRGGFSFFRFDKSTIRYLGSILLLGLFLSGGLISSAFLLRYGSPVREFSSILNIFLLVVLFRFGLALPAAAIGWQQHPFKQSWNSTHGSVLRLMLVFFLTPLPFLVLLGYVSFHQFASMVSDSQSNSIFYDLLLSAVHSVLSVFSMMIVTISYSLCYDVLVRGRKLNDECSL